MMILPDIRKQDLFMSPVFGSKYGCEQLFNQMKNVKSRARTRLADEHLEGCMRIATTEIKPDTETLLKQKLAPRIPST
jgi:hypothetical protein